MEPQAARSCLDFVGTGEGAADSVAREDTDSSLFAVRRASLTLRDIKVLRGTCAAEILRCFGKQLRSSPGQYSTASSAERNYERSFPVSELSIFLSHSWLSKWWLKYILLLIYFNSMPAVICGTIGTTIFSFSRARAVGRSIERDGRWISTLFGVAVTLTTLFVWQDVMKLCRRRSRPIFFDKLCIHQVDKELKQRGIESISAIVGRSDVLLLACDTDYFLRLWCPFEIAAFRIANPTGRIHVFPIPLAGLTLVLAMGSLVHALVSTYFYEKHDAFGEVPEALNPLEEQAILFADHCWNVVATVMLSKYSDDIAALKKELEGYSIRRARCFCCDHSHRHPLTGDELLCDRELIYASVGRWYGSRGGEIDAGLDAFDSFIQSMWHEEVVTTFGRAGVPYSVAALSGTLLALYFLSAVVDRLVHGEHERYRSLFFVLYALEVCLLEFPMIIGIILWMSRAIRKCIRPLNTLHQMGRVVIVSFTITLLDIGNYKLYSLVWSSIWLLLAKMCVELVVVSLLYRCCQRHIPVARVRRWQRWLPEADRGVASQSLAEMVDRRSTGAGKALPAAPRNHQASAA